MALALRGFSVVMALAIGSILLADEGNTSKLYHGIWMMPFAFALSATILNAVARRYTTPFLITYAIVYTLLFVRLVVTPLAIYLAGVNYTGLLYISVVNDDIRRAINMIAYESVVIAILFFLTAPLLGRETVRLDTGVLASTRISGSRIVYGAFSAIGLVVLIVWGLPSGIVNFLIIREGTLDDELGAGYLLLRQIMVISAWLFFIWTASHSAKSYARTNRLLFFVMALLAGGAVIFLIIGDRRSFQVFTGAAVIYVLMLCFPDKRRIIVASIGSFSLVAILSMTFWRLFARYGLEIGDFSALSFLGFDVIATALQAYVGGPLQIAIGNIVLATVNIGLSNLAFDLARSVFLLNFLVRDEGMLSSQIYNEFIYSGDHLTGLIIFSASYGYTIFGVVFLPIFVSANLLLAMLTEVVLRRCRGLETKFLFAYILMRTVIFIFISTPLILSVYTLQLFTFGLLIYSAQVLKQFDRPFLMNAGAGRSGDLPSMDCGMSLSWPVGKLHGTSKVTHKNAKFDRI